MYWQSFRALSSHTNRYRLGKPSAEYEHLVSGFDKCVQYAITIHLFATDVVVVHDAEEDQVIGLEMLLELMTEQDLDRSFIYEHGSVLYDLLRELGMNKNFPFMLELVSHQPTLISILFFPPR